MSSFIRTKTVGDHALTTKERDKLIELLCEDHSFNLEKLLKWLASLRLDSFWSEDQSQKELNYSAAQVLYLEHIYKDQNGHDYATEMRVLAELMWEGRRDAAIAMTIGVEFTPVMDAALITLAEHMNHFNVLYAFDQAHFRATASTLEEAQLYATHYAGQSAFEAAGFALEWLTFHLPYYAKGHRDSKTQAAAQARATSSSGSDDSTMWSMEPGVGQ